MMMVIHNKPGINSLIILTLGFKKKGFNAADCVGEEQMDGAFMQTKVDNVKAILLKVLAL